MAFSVAAAAREVRYIVDCVFFSHFLSYPVLWFRVIFVHVSSINVCILTSVVRDYGSRWRAFPCAGSARVVRAHSSWVFVAQTPVRQFVYCIYRCSPPGFWSRHCSENRTSTADRYDRVMSFDNWPVSGTGNVKCILSIRRTFESDIEGAVNLLRIPYDDSINETSSWVTRALQSILLWNVSTSLDSLPLLQWRVIYFGG